jgi:hypothetical protein
VRAAGEVNEMIRRKVVSETKMKCIALGCRRIQTRECVVQAPKSLSNKHLVELLEARFGNVEIEVIGAVEVDADADPELIDIWVDDSGQSEVAEWFWEDFDE